MQTHGIGYVSVPVSFGSGVAFDGSVPYDDGVINDDGYIVDAYGAGLHGVVRTGVGEYEVLLKDQYFAMITASGAISSSSAKDIVVQFGYPSNAVVTRGGIKFTRIVVRLLAAAVPTDLAYNDRVSLFFVMDRSSA